MYTFQMTTGISEWHFIELVHAAWATALRCTRAAHLMAFCLVPSNHGAPGKPCSDSVGPAAYVAQNGLRRAGVCIGHGWAEQVTERSCYIYACVRGLLHVVLDPGHGPWCGAGGRNRCACAAAYGARQCICACVNIVARGVRVQAGATRRLPACVRPLRELGHAGRGTGLTYAGGKLVLETASSLLRPLMEVVSWTEPGTATLLAVTGLHWKAGPRRGKGHKE